MISEMRSYVLDLVLSEFETGHILCDDYNEFKELIKEDGYRPSKEMYRLYCECHELGPVGFYEEYRDELSFSDDFIREYGQAEDAEGSYITGEDLRVAIDEEMPFIRENIGENGTLDDAVNDFMLACEEANKSADRSEVETILADYFDSETADTISEALSNMDKLRKAFPELNNPALTEAREEIEGQISMFDEPDCSEKIRNAVGILYDMDRFVLDVMDNEYWLAMGVPDAEFLETSREDAMDNCDEHDWLIKDENNFVEEDFIDLLHAFENATEDPNEYDVARRDEIIAAAKALLHEKTNESYDEEGNPEKCQNCGTLLNDQGTCPKCDDGEEDLDECDKALNEETLTEGPFGKFTQAVKDTFDPMKRADRSRERADKKVANQNLKILARDFDGKGNKWTFKIKDGNSYKDYNQQEWVRMFRDAHDELKADPESAEARAKIAQQSNAIVIDENNMYVRRGLEDFLGNPFKFSEGKNDTPKQAYTVKVPSEAEVAEEEREEAAADRAEQAAVSKIDPATVTRFAKLATVMSKVLYHQKDGKMYRLRNLAELKPEMLPDVYLTSKGGKPLSEILPELKSQDLIEMLESDEYDDYMDESWGLDSVETDLDEGLSEEERAQLFDLAREIGIKNGADANKFVKNERAAGESTLDTLKRYRDGLGDDFELIEEVETEYEDLSANLISYNDLLASMVDNSTQEQIDGTIRTLDKVAKYFKVKPENLAIFRDSIPSEYDPITWMDDGEFISKYLGVYFVADIKIVKEELGSTMWLYFKSVDEADKYLKAAQRGNI